MKKIYIFMAVLATAALTSCQQEKSFNDENLMDNTLVFSLKGAPSTRSMKTGAIIEKGVTFELGTDEEGNSFFLEETIQDLNAAWTPATKGTPAYTENVGVLYEKMGVHAGSSDYEFYSMDNSEGSATGKMVDGGWRYQGEFTWAQDAYDFYFWMPTTDNGITGTPTYAKTGNDLSITFSYQSPTTAAAQKDLIFAARNITKAEAIENRVNGVPILFNHALTGVKFAIKNYDATKNITIKSVSFSGLYDGGTCTIIPAIENNYRDKPTEEYSSGDGRVSWPATSLTKSGTAIASGSFGEPVDFEGTAFTNKGNYPASFGDAGNMQNLNDGDASQTFWLIPQTLTDAVTLTIKYTFGSTEEQTWVIDFGEIIADKGDAVWEAGQLRTYTLKVDDINVHIADQISSSHVKQNIAITNTGNTDEFIRAVIIGNWCDPDGAAVFGFTDFIDNPGQYVEIPSWTIDQTGGGTFVGLPTATSSTTPAWVRGNDGYFYYTAAIAPGATAPALFTSYTPGPTPAYQLAGKDVDAHFVMEIATQAISAKKPDASDYTWSEAWTNALGYNPSNN